MITMHDDLIKANMVDILYKINELDTFLIGSGFERRNEMELVYYMHEGSKDVLEATLTIGVPNPKDDEYE